MRILANLDLSQNELQNAKLQNLTTAPSNAVAGQIYFNSGDNCFYGYNGTSWINLGQVLTGDSIISLLNTSSSIIDDNNLSSNVNDAIAKKHSHSNYTILDGTTASYLTAEKTKLSGIATGAEVNVQSDWNENVTTSDDYIKNKPTLAPSNADKTSTTIIGSTEVTTLSDTNIIPVSDNSSSLNKITFANIKVVLKTYFDTLYNKYILPIATSTVVGGVKSGTDITVDASGNVSVNDDSHNHIISNVDGLQTALDGKVDDSQVLTNVPVNAKFTDTIYTLPISSDTTLGGIKIGANLTIGTDGTLNANDNPSSFIVKQENFIATEGQTVFTLTKGTYLPNSNRMFWYWNFVKQESSTLTESSSTTVTFPSDMLEAGDEILFEYIQVIDSNPYPIHASEHLTGGLDPIDTVTQTANGLMLATDKTKLDGIETGALANKIEIVEKNGTALTITNKTVNVIVPTKTSDITNDSGFITSSASITGNAGTATKLVTARTISTTGDATGSVSFDGSVNVTHALTLANSGVTAGTYPKVTVDAKGRVTAGTSLSASDIPTLTLSKISDVGTVASKNTGIASGNIPILDSNGKIDTTVLPALAITDTFPVASETAMLALTAQIGDVAIRTDLRKSFILQVNDPTVLANWQELLTPTDVVTSVAGKTGAVTLVQSDVGLGNATNESKTTMFTNPTFTGTATATTFSGDLSGNATTSSSCTGNSATATKLSTARTISLTGDVTGSASFDGSANPTITAVVVDDSHNHVISNVDNLQTTLDSKTPFATSYATTAATAQWYRIATSDLNIGTNSGLFKIDFSGTGVKGNTLFRAACHDGSASGSGISQLGFTTTAPTLGLTQVRVVYHTTYTGNYAYVEVYNPTALAITYTVDLIDTTGWSLVTPSTVGSIPSGYTSESLTLDTGFVSAEDVTAIRQLRSNIATGTAPLVVASTTKVINLNVDRLDDQDSSYYLSRTNHTGTQLASTISDFAATVRSTVLTGLSTATNTVVVATDSILVAIGKLQEQITVHLTDTVKHITSSERTAWNAKTDIYAVNIGDGTATTFTVAHNLGTKDISVSLEEVSTGEIVYTDVEKVDTNNISVLFATAPTSSQFRVTVIG